MLSLRLRQNSFNFIYNGPILLVWVTHGKVEMEGLIQKHFIVKPRVYVQSQQSYICCIAFKNIAFHCIGHRSSQSICGNVRLSVCTLSTPSQAEIPASRDRNTRVEFKLTQPPAPAPLSPTVGRLAQIEDLRTTIFYIFSTQIFSFLFSSSDLN